MQEVKPRELKSAKIKFSIYKELLKSSVRKSFHDIYVRDLCKKAGISKVTFFKYYHQKEELLEYYMRVWLIELNIILNKKKVEGLAGIHEIFDQIGDQCLQHPKLVFAYITYVSNLRLPKKPYQITLAEKQLIFQDMEAVQSTQVLSLEQLFEKYLLEAIFNKEITKTGDTKELSLLLYSIFFGSIFIINLKSIKYLKHFFRKNIDHLVEGLG